MLQHKRTTTFLAGLYLVFYCAFDLEHGSSVIPDDALADTGTPDENTNSIQKVLSVAAVGRCACVEYLALVSRYEGACA